MFDRGLVYFTSTQGGGPPEPGPSDPVQGFGNGFGQVWAYDPSSSRLRLVYQSPGPEVLDLPDNVTVSRRGTLVLCEDSTDNYLRALSRRGSLSDIALNRLVGANGVPRIGDEFAGACFSPDGHTLFVNIQAPSGGRGARSASDAPAPPPSSTGSVDGPEAIAVAARAARQ